MKTSVVRLLKNLDLRREDVPEALWAEIEAHDWRVYPLRGAAFDRAVIRIVDRLVNGDLAKTGNLDRWEAGWGEALMDYAGSQDDDDLVPRYIHQGEIMRVSRELVQTHDPNFEENFCRILLSAVDEFSFVDLDRVVEFGCGTGWNLLHLAKRTPGREYEGYDWSRAAADLVKMAAENNGLSIKTGVVDFFNPPHPEIFEGDTGVLTFGALEQTGANFEPFIRYLINRRPSVVVHIEPIVEWYAPQTSLLDYLAVQFLIKRRYWSGFAEYMSKLARKGLVNVEYCHRTGIGSLFMEGYMVFVWRPT